MFFSSTTTHYYQPCVSRSFFCICPRSLLSVLLDLFYSSIDIARLQTRAQRRAALEASSSSVRSAARRARIVSSVRPGAQRAKSPPAVRAASSCEAEPAAEPVADPPSLRCLLCLRCAKRASVDPSSSCFFDKENSKKCLYCHSQKSKCLPVSTFLPCFFLFSYANLSSSTPPWPFGAISSCAYSRSWPNLVRPNYMKPFGAGSFGFRPVSKSSRFESRARRPRPRGKMLWLRPIFKFTKPPPPT
jgi:hypothetical protein